MLPPPLKPETFSLTLEQELELLRLKEAIAVLDREEAIARLMESARVLMIKDNLIRDILRQQL